MPPESKKLMKDMLDILKMTASLMKFGRLVNFYDKNKHLFATPRGSGKGIDARALNDITSVTSMDFKLSNMQRQKSTWPST